MARTIPEPNENPTVCRIQMFSPAGNSWAYFKSYYCAFQYALFLNEHTVDFALYRGDVTALHKTHSEIFLSMTELERLAKEES